MDEVGVMDTSSIGDDDALRAGYPSREDLISDLRGAKTVYRVAFHLEGPDPRVALRQRDELSEEEWERLESRLNRMDAAGHDGPWTGDVLQLISDRPETRAGDLAAQLGRERVPFKRDVRKLKELGLTESLERGYRLSPRGRALLARLQRG